MQKPKAARAPAAPLRYDDLLRLLESPSEARRALDLRGPFVDLRDGRPIQQKKDAAEAILADYTARSQRRNEIWTATRNAARRAGKSDAQATAAADRKAGPSPDRPWTGGAFATPDGYPFNSDGKPIGIRFAGEPTLVELLDEFSRTVRRSKPLISGAAKAVQRRAAKALTDGLRALARETGFFPATCRREAMRLLAADSVELLRLLGKAYPTVNWSDGPGAEELVPPPHPDVERTPEVAQRILRGAENRNRVEQFQRLRRGALFNLGPWRDSPLTPAAAQILRELPELHAMTLARSCARGGAPTRDLTPLARMVARLTTAYTWGRGEAVRAIAHLARAKGWKVSAAHAVEALDHAAPKK